MRSSAAANIIHHTHHLLRLSSSLLAFSNYSEKSVDFAAMKTHLKAREHMVVRM